MSKFLRLSVMITGLFIIMACIFTSCDGGGPVNPIVPEVSVVRLRVEPQASTVPYNAADQVINYSYLVQNTGISPLAGPVLITDSKAAALCPNLNTIGNKDEYLDPTESITCASAYRITQADVTTGSVTTTATARVGGIDSNLVTAVVPMAQNKVLTITKTANPTTYSQPGQTITYTYVVKNTGAATLGPAPFTVTDDRIPSPINCGTATQILATNESVTCTATYTISQADLSAAQIVNSASASGAGATTIQPASVTVTNLVGGATAIPPSNIARGSTVRHDVVKGEWLLQISRCYGADLKAVQNANPQIVDPHWIFEDRDIVTVPNVGSVGTIYGPPCVILYTVKSGDTWQSIAQAHNADIIVLQEANKTLTLSAGTVIKVPRNSAGGTVVTPPTAIPPRQPIRLNFTAGTPTITQPGTIGTPDTIRYVFTGATGQILTVRLTVPTNDVGLAIYAPGGTALKPLDNTLSWSGTLNANGDYFIDLVSSLGAVSKSYSLEVTLTTPAPASPIERVADINAGVADSNPSHLSVFNGKLYFQATGNDGAGAELWSYDSGLKAVSRVADMNAGAGGSEPSFLTPYSDLLYFRANGNDAAGLELWRFNGSATGRVTDMNGGAADANPMYLTVFNNALYFSANGNDGKGTELWKYDGTVTSRVSDINPDAGDSSPAYLKVFNNALYFSATSNDGAGTELWKYDGTTTTRVADISVGVGNSNPAFLTVFNNALYFSANGDAAGTELWRYDGTTAPARAADINPGGDSIPTYLTVFNNALYFSANGDAAGFELWRYDGTNFGRVADINTAGNANPSHLAVYNNELYFQANGNDGAGAELWKFKGP